VQAQRFGVQVPPVPEHRRPEFFIGDKVMQVRNNYGLELMNGAIGVVRDIVQEEDEKTKRPVEVLVLDFDGRPVHIPRQAEEADDLMLAYASTVHKSQGSEFPVIIAVVHRAQSFMLNRNLLYTAVTRAQRSAILLGDAVGMRRAIDRRDVDARRTFLALADPADAMKGGSV
jgi:exodeoxyribonuclease V alpha subunit